MTLPIQALATQLQSSLQTIKEQTVPQAAPSGVAQAQGGGFKALFVQGLQRVAEVQHIATVDGNAVAAGVKNAPSLAETMVAMQKSSVAFQELIAVRNQLVRGYTTLINMPV